MSKSSGLMIRGNTNYHRLQRNAQMTGVSTAINGQGPMLYNEGWVTATADTTNIWDATTAAGTGSFARAIVAPRGVGRLNCPAAADIQGLIGRRAIFNPVAASATADMYQQVVLEFEALLGTIANQDNVHLVMGLDGDNAARTGNDKICFILASDALNTLTDKSGTETVNVVASPPTLTNSNHYCIVVRNGAADFWVNRTLAWSHTTNLMTGIFFPSFRCGAEAGTGATKLEIGNVRCFLLDTTTPYAPGTS